MGRHVMRESRVYSDNERIAIRVEEPMIMSCPSGRDVSSLAGRPQDHKRRGGSSDVADDDESAAKKALIKEGEENHLGDESRANTPD